MRVTNNVYVLSGSYYGAVGDERVLGDVYGVRTGAGLILIDCGMPDTGLAAIRETLAYYEIEDQITHLILTHGHTDHCGNAKALQDAGARVIAGAEDAFMCENGGNKGLATPFSDGHIFPAFSPDILVDKDCSMDLNGLNVRFIKIPGHTKGSMAALINIDKKKILFTGDALQPGGGQLNEVSFGWQGDIGFSRADIVASMQKLMTVETDMVLPGHGKVCLKNGTQMLRFAARTAFQTMR
jgi:glyoxylase-like metal-dependent hydrolase (beta-lactamase superfamily II)